MGIKRLCFLFFLFSCICVCSSSSAWAWGPHTHVFFGWVAANQITGCPWIEQSFFPYTNLQPDIAHLTHYGYCHGDQRFPEIMFNVVSLDDAEKGYALGWIAHQFEDYWGHTFYIPRDQFKHAIAEFSVDSVIYNSPDPFERDFIRGASLSWNPSLTSATSLEHTALYGGDPIPELEWDAKGYLLAKAMAAEKAIIGNRFFYMYARARFPREDWQVYLDNSVADIETWCAGKGKSDGLPSGGYRHKTETVTGWPASLETFLINLSDHLANKSAIEINAKTSRHNLVKIEINLTNREYVDRILHEFLYEQSCNPASPEDRLYAEVFQLLTQPYDSNDKEFDSILNQLIEMNKTPGKLLLNFDPVK